MPTNNHPRSHRRERVDWEARWNAFGRLEDGTVLDVSAAGAFIATSSTARMRSGTRVQLWFNLKERRRVISVTGTVRWTGVSPTYGRSGFGIQFDQIQFAVGAHLFANDPGEGSKRLQKA
jgi:hypothetical protein